MINYYTKNDSEMWLVNSGARNNNCSGNCLLGSFFNRELVTGADPVYEGDMAIWLPP